MFKVKVGNKEKTYRYYASAVKWAIVNATSVEELMEATINGEKIY